MVWVIPFCSPVAELNRWLGTHTLSGVDRSAQTRQVHINSPRIHLHTPPNPTCSRWYDHEWLKADYKPDSPTLYVGYFHVWFFECGLGSFDARWFSDVKIFERLLIPQFSFNFYHTFYGQYGNQEEYRPLLFWQSAKLGQLTVLWRWIISATLPLAVNLSWFYLGNSQADRRGPWASCLMRRGCSVNDCKLSYRAGEAKLKTTMKCVWVISVTAHQHQKGHTVP